MARELFTLLTTTAPGWPIWKSVQHLEQITEFIGKFPEWYYYNKNLEEHVRSLRTKMECLEGVQADVETQLENTELQSGKKRKREVDLWMKSVRKKAEDVNKVENDINSASYLPRFLYRAYLGSQIGGQMEQLSELHQQGQFPEGLLLDATRDGGEPFVSSPLVGRAVQGKIDDILLHLREPEVVRVGVQGAEGIGKTAVVTQVYNRLCQNSCVYYVNVEGLKNFDTYSLQAAIASAMKVKIPKTEGSENRRAARIFSVLESRNEYFLILDGLSRDFYLEDVGIPVAGGAGKLILTSRSEDVCRRMLCQKTVVLECLSTEDSETLFFGILAADPPLSEETRKVADHFIRRCEGIPSRIKHMAVHMRCITDKNEWRNTLKDMLTFKSCAQISQLQYL